MRTPTPITMSLSFDLGGLNRDRYWLTQAQIPSSLLVDPAPELSDWLRQASKNHRSAEDLVTVDLEIAQGHIRHILPPGSAPSDAVQMNLQLGQVWPCFVDSHTHLDKGHIWPRTPNPDGTFDSALEAVMTDAEQYNSFDDVYPRFEFGLKCSYAHGTQAIRTHIDAFGQQGEIGFEVFRQLREAWRDRLTLQAVCLVSLDYFMGPEGEKLADLVAESGGILGGVGYENPQLEQQIERVFELAGDRSLDLDFHVDESGNPADQMLPKVAQAAVQQDFSGKVTCDHCCSLAVQDDATRNDSIALVKAANIAVISLPLCNLYLQDRQPSNQPRRTPRWRGITAVHELDAAGVPVAFASDNCRDPFYGFGDHDMLEVWRESVRIGHLDRPYQAWPQSVTRTPADLMRLPKVGRISVGLPANLVLFRGRGFSELLSRSQHDRIVLRQGKPIDTTLPNYEELDDLLRVM